MLEYSQRAPGSKTGGCVMANATRSCEVYVAERCFRYPSALRSGTTSAV